MKTSARRIKKDKDIEALIYSLLPKNVQKHIDRTSFEGFGGHARETILTLLWDNGHCTPQHRDRIYECIADRGQWAASKKSEDKNVHSDLLTEPSVHVQRTVQRIREDISKSEWRKFVAIDYEDRKSKTFHLLTSAKDVVLFWNEYDKRKKQRGKEKPLEIVIKADECMDGIPVLSEDDLINISLRSPRGGYLHVFHIDANRHVDKLFPDENTTLELKVSCHIEYDLPEQLSTEETAWIVGETEGMTSGRQELVAIVIPTNRPLENADLKDFGIDVRTRTAYVRKPALANIKRGSIAIGRAEYEMRTK